MTVKCIDDESKTVIASLYSSKQYGSDDLGIMYGVSARTIQRVLVERGVNQVRNYPPRFLGARQVDMFKPEPVKQPEIDLPITMLNEPPEMPAPEAIPTLQPETQPKPFVARLWAFIKGALSFPFK